MVLYTRPHNVADLKQTLNTFALRKNGTERGAKKHRITFTDEDKTKGSLVVYAVKYISKNVDGHGMVEDEHGKPILTERHHETLDHRGNQRLMHLESGETFNSLNAFCRKTGVPRKRAKKYLDGEKLDLLGHEFVVLND